jgi:CYTH domain-containing protein
MRRFKKECERKFLIKYLPDDFENYLKQEVSQCYLFFNRWFCIRIRKYDDSRKYLDFKFGSGKIKFKIGFKVNFWTNKKCLKKTRYKKRIGDILIVIDIFESRLMLVEIESSKCDVINNFKKLDWFGDEVTNNEKYRNRFMI